MAKPSFDIKKMLLASLLTIGIGVVLVILSVILELLSLVITDQNAGLVDMVNTGYLLVLFPIFLALYFWTGMRAVQNFQFDAVSAGAVAAFSYIVTALIELVLEIVLAVIIVSRPVGGVGFGSTEMVLATSLFGGMMGLSGVALSAVCGIGMVAIGALMNFVIGGFGALFALRKSE